MLEPTGSYKSSETDINEITGAIELMDEPYIRALMGYGVKQGLQFPLSTAAGIPSSGVGSVLIDATFDASWVEYQIIK